jgi:hypothetical protein
MTTTRRTFIFESLALGGIAVTDPARLLGAVQRRGSPTPTPPPQHQPQILRVKIYLVPEDVLGGGWKPRTRLTDAQLKKAEDHVKQVATAQGLGPTSIIVVRDQPTSYTNVAKRGQPTVMKLLRHDPNGHRETVLPVWTESDRVEWQSVQAFEIVGIQKAPRPGFQAAGASVPANPFYDAVTPYSAKESGGSYIIQTSTARRESNGQQYKITFRIAGRIVDPDIACGFPPPGS